MKKTLLLFLLFAVSGFSPQTIHADQDIKVMVRQKDTTLNYQAIEDGKLLVSVLGPDDEPVRGLTLQDFVVGRGIQRAEIISAAPLETTEEVALNVVLVVDNSFSMKERRAVAPLLEAMDEFFKTVRPIDNIHLVVFDEHPAPQLELQGLHARTFNSGNADELRNFLRESLDNRSTGKTYLYEAMAAGIDIIRRMPEQDNKFMVVFSDGEDFNSRIPNVLIEEQSQEIKNLEVYCVDYMPGAKLDRFLTSFAKSHAGRIWKATSASELLPIFQSFTTALRYRYVVTYRMLDPLTAEPAGLNFEIMTMVDGTPIANAVFFETGQSDIPPDYVLFKDPAGTTSFDTDSLTTARERYLNILNIVGQHLSRNPDALIKIVGCNSNSGIEADNLDLSRRRAEAVKSYLQQIWGIQGLRMGIEARNLPDHATSKELVGARPENQRVEIAYDSDKMQAAAPGDFIAETAGRRELKVRANLFAEAGISDWQLTIFGDDQPFKSLTGQGEMPPDQLFSLQDLDKAKLSKFGALAIQARITDSGGDTHETSKLIVPITVSLEKWDDAILHAPQGSITLEPAAVTIEELTTIDSSPFLNYIYFAGGESEIPPRYALLKSQSEAASFDENNLKDTMEKHHNVLNVIGRRLQENPDSTIRIVGCNSNRDEEQGKTDLSRSRAEAVRAYLKYIWGIDGSRMQVEARNLPEVASTSSRVEGREENQRVEIYSDSPALLDIVRSTYVQEISDADQFVIKPQVTSGYEIDQWAIKLSGDGTHIESLQGQGDINPVYQLSLAAVGLDKISAYRTITASIEVTDRKGQTAKAAADSTIRFVKRQELMAQKQGYRVQEKYALILFDFDRSDIKEKNKEIIDRIAARIKQIPNATVRIVGHTDTIGQEAYNLDLSTRRAKTAYENLLAGGVPAGDNITFEGIGPRDALFDNDLPEGRALNRTVTVTLEYEQTE